MNNFCSFWNIFSHTIRNIIILRCPFSATVQPGFNKAIILSFACIHLISIVCVCMTCSMNLARNTNTGVTVMCLHRILVWKRRHPVQCWSIREADTRTLLLLYWIAFHNVTGINRYKAILSQYRICTIVFTGKLKHIWNTYCFIASNQTNIYLRWLVLFELWKCLSKTRENKGNCNLFVFVLPTYIMIKIADGYKMVGRYYCMIMESLDWFFESYGWFTNLKVYVRGSLSWSWISIKCRGNS